MPYLGATIVTIPAYPPAPANIDFIQVDPTAENISPFTGQQQVQSWQATWMELSVSMPPMRHVDGQNWVTFLRQLQGTANVFQFSAAFMAAYPELGNRYWRLKSNARKWSVTSARLYGIQFECREAL